MSKSRCTEDQMVGALGEADATYDGQREHPALVV